MGAYPLAGVRIIEAGQAWALPFATGMLAALGAEVIKVESAARPDARADGGGAFNEINRNKRGVSLDLRTRHGVEVYRQLVAISDIVAENFSPRVMGNLGLDYPNLRHVRPDLIMLSSTAFGGSGPWMHYTGYGPNLEGAVGLTHVTGYPDGPPLRSGIAFSDIVAAVNGAFAMITALDYRQRTGKGQWIDLSQYEVGIAHLGEAMMEYFMNGTSPGRIGNRHPWMAPHGVYPCRGDDAWIAIAVATQAQWEALVREMGSPAWAAAPEYATTFTRLKNHDSLDAHLSAWTRHFDKRELMERLQRAGVPAGAVLNAKEVMLDPHVRARRMFEAVDHPAPVGRRPHLSSPWLLNGERSVRGRLAPSLGRDTEEVLHELLGLAMDRIEALWEEGVISNEPLGERPSANPATGGLPAETLLKIGRIAGYDPDPLKLLGFR